MTAPGRRPAAATEALLGSSTTPSSRRLSFALGAAILVVFVIAGGFALSAWSRHRYQQLLLPVGPGETRPFEVKRGDTVGRLGERLQAAHLVRDARAFRRRARERRLGGQLKAGWYQLSPASSVDQILDEVVSGKVSTRRVTLPEGLDLKGMAERCADAGIGDAAEYVRLATSEAASFGLKDLPAGATLEGYLYPATYHLPLDAGPRELIEAQVKRFTSIWRELSSQRQPARPRHEVVTIASLVEREVKVAEERARVAGVIENRLRQGLKLELCSTVQYALGVHKERLLLRDLQVDSPYNTYRQKGLPPGPIASPGRASLAAAARPARHDYLFFVLAGDGRHVFSRTAAEHRRAKAEAEKVR